ncbi:MAG TPA: methyltransferase domain-containing protein [Ktedonobacterales bacterium]|jgi:protein-L-isoaspartate(D-aspartate) O-methyltransferase
MAEEPRSAGPTPEEPDQHPPTTQESWAERSNHLRAELVEQLKARDVLHSAAVEAAFLRVPREHFLPELARSEGLEAIYSDEAIITKRTGQGTPLSSSSAPSMMAIMLEQLDLCPGLRVLEVGAGTGYNAALLAELVGDSRAVVTIDIDQEVVEQARRNLASAGYPEITVLCVDGVLGAPDLGPFDRIELTVASDDIAPAWCEQLVSGGRLVLPLELHRHQRGQLSLALVKHAEYLESAAASYAFFIPLRGDQAMAVEHIAPLGVMTHQETGHRWELNAFGEPFMAAPQVRRDALHLLSSTPTTYDLRLRGETRGLLTYLELRYGETELIHVWSGQAIWGFEGWCAGVLSHPLQAESPGQAFPLLPSRRNQRPGIALLRPATASPDDAGLGVVLLYGNTSALQRLKMLAREWDGLQRPDLAALRVRAYAPGKAPAPSSGEWVINKRSVQLLLSFQPVAP